MLIPRTYPVPEFVPRSGVQFWDLPTGSHIAYTHILRTSDCALAPILYVHGGPGGAVRPEHISALQPLAKLGHDLYFYDQIGSGQSGRLYEVAEYSVARHSADLRDVIEQIDAPKVILIGHSWGSVLVANCSTPQKHRQWLSSIFESLKPLKHEKHPQKIHRQV